MRQNRYIDKDGSPTIRVMHIIDRLNIGGPAKYVTWLTAGMDPEEFETLLITGTVPPGEGDMGYFAQAAGVEPLIIKEMSRELSPRDVMVIYKLLLEIFRFRPHIIHTHKAKAGAAGRIAAWFYKWLTPSVLWLSPRVCRVVHIYHGHIFHSYYGKAKTRLFLAIERVLAKLCTDRIITLSEHQMQEICGRFKVGKRDQYSVIPLGIDFEEIKQSKGRLRRDIIISENIPLVGIIGRLCEVKNHAMFLDVIALLKKEGVKAHFVVIGDGHLREALESQVRELDISELVSFTGFRDDAALLYTDLDILALTSLNEGTPMVLIEAMSCGIPVVATEVGGVIDLMGLQLGITDGFTIWDRGLTAPSRNVEAFANALRYSIESVKLREEMGLRSSVFVRSRMSKDRLIEDIANFYRELLCEAGESREEKAKYAN